MPYYRQASMQVCYSTSKDALKYLDVLYNNKPYLYIEAALDYYFENYNNGKPFVLAGHSQGSALIINALTHYMHEHKEYLSRMIVAYSIGYAPSEDIFNESTGIKFATRQDDYNVVISFTTEGPTALGNAMYLPEKSMIINPLTWTTDDKYGSANLNKGAMHLSPSKDSLVLEPGRDDAQINLNRKTLVCTTRTLNDCTIISPDSFSTESFHERENGMYYVNLKDNLHKRIEVYFANNK